MLPGLHVTLASFLRNNHDWSDYFVAIFTSGVSESEKKELRDTAQQARAGIEIEFRDADISLYSGLKPLHGDLMTYTRLSLARIFNDHSRILYLDADLLIRSSLKELVHVNMGEAPFAASGVGVIKFTLENDFYMNVLKIDGDGRAFNAGVLLINAERWRRDDLETKCIKFGEKYKMYLGSADQTILTAMFSADFFPLPAQYNVSGAPSVYPASDAVILHYVGSPKPWDVFARFVHLSWPEWSACKKDTAMGTSSFFFTHMTEILRRTWIIRRSYFREYLRIRKLKSQRG